jgi:hypothetical protein
MGDRQYKFTEMPEDRKVWVEIKFKFILKKIIYI